MTTRPNTDLEFDIRQSSSPTPAADLAGALESPAFGQVFTDHMITIRWSRELGWYDARLEPYGPLKLDPSASVFHYGQEIFEGLKAYRQISGRIVTFRPEANAARLNLSARRLAMPELPESIFIRAIDLLVRQDRAWVPSPEGYSLYLRPFMIATEPRLSEDYPSSTFLFTVIASPVSSYFPQGIRPVTVALAEGYSRAARGGTGEAKCGINYGGTFAGQEQAIENGCDQVVWLDAIERRWVEELGGMNIMFVHGADVNASLMTPQLTGALLPGIIRDSLLRISPGMGIPAVEGMISVEEWKERSESGEISETFACGTAAVITPIGKVKGSNAEWTIGDGTPGPVTMRLRQRLIDIQYGNEPDLHGWIHEIC